MTETLPDFDPPMTVPEAPAPKKARRKSQRISSRKPSAPRATAAKPPRAVKRHKKVDRRTKAFRSMADYKAVQDASKLTFPPADNSPSSLDIALNIYSRIGALLTTLSAPERKVLLVRLLKEEGA